jgi:hypothetical protein
LPHGLALDLALAPRLEALRGKGVKSHGRKPVQANQ